MKEQLQLRQKRDFGQKINATFQFITGHFKPLATVILYIVLPLQLVMSVLTAYYTGNYFQDVSSGEYSGMDMFLNDNYKMTLLTSMLTGFVHLLLGIVIFSYMKLLDKGYDTSPSAVWDEAKQHILKAFSLGILSYFLLIIAFLALIIPGFYVMVVFSLLLPIIVFEDADMSYAFSESFKLIKNKWWSTFGLIIVMSLLVGVFVSVFSIPSTILTMFSVKSPDLKPVFIVLQTLTGLVTVFAYAVLYVALAFQYFNLVERNYNTGLLTAIEQLGTNQQRTDEYDDDEA